MKRLNNHVAITGHLFFVAYLLLCYWYADARIYFADSAYHLFDMLQTGEPLTIGRRYGQVATQVLPLLGAKLGWSVPTLVKAYSLNHALFYYGIFLFTLYGLRSRTMATVLVWCMLLFMGPSFFWPQSTMLQALAWMLPGMALLYRASTVTWWQQLAAGVFLVLGLFTHPISILALLFFMVWLAINRPEWRVRYLLWGALVVVFYLLKNALLDTGAYDAERMNLQQLMTQLTQLQEVKSLPVFARWLLWPHGVVVLLWGGLSFKLIQQQKWWGLGVFNLFFWGALLLVALTYPRGGSHELYYFETLFLPAAFVLGMAAMYVWNAKPARLALLTLVLTGVGWFQLFNAAPLFTKRVAFMDAFIEDARSQRHHKYYMLEEEVPADISAGQWSTCFGVLLRSSANADTSVTLLTTPAVPDTITADHMLIPWGAIYTGDLNPNYFYLPNEKYRRYQAPF